MYSIQSTTEYLYTSALDKTNTLHTEWCITAQTRKAYACSVDVSLCLFSLSYPRLFSLFSFLLSILSLFPTLCILPSCILSVFYTLAQLNQGSSAQPESSLFNQSILLSFTLYSFFLSFFLSLHSLSSFPSHSHPSLLTPAYNTGRLSIPIPTTPPSPTSLTTLSHIHTLSLTANFFIPSHALLFFLIFLFLFCSISIASFHLPSFIYSSILSFHSIYLVSPTL